MKRGKEGRSQEAELWEVKLNQTEMCNVLVGECFSHSSKMTCRDKDKIDAFSDLLFSLLFSLFPSPQSKICLVARVTTSQEHQLL